MREVIAASRLTHLPAKAQTLLKSQDFGTVATSIQNRPLASIVRFAFGQFRPGAGYEFLLGVHRASAKCKQMKRNPFVTLLVDDRNVPPSVMRLTVQGTVRQVPRKKRAFKQLLDFYLEKNPRSRDFFAGPDAELLLLTPERVWLGSDMDDTRELMALDMPEGPA